MSHTNIKMLLSHFWRPLLVGICAFVVAGFLLFVHLGSTPAKLSSGELPLSNNVSYSLHDTIQNPVDAPFKVPEHFLIKWFPNSAAAARATAVIYGALSLVLFFAILRFWHDWLIATLGTIIFASSSWFLHISRLATPNVLFFGVLTLLGCALWIRHTLRRELAVIVSAAVIASLLYVPGFIWFVLIGAAFKWKSILKELKHTKPIAKAIAAVIFVVIILPIALALLRHPNIGWAFLGFPNHLPHAIQIWRNFYHVPEALFVHESLQSSLWVGHLPILDIFEDVMLVLGIYVLWRYRGLDRSEFIFGMMILGLILVTIGGPVGISIIMPTVYLTIALGVSYLLDSWMRVFPSNPVARSLGYFLITAAIVISCNYQIERYFIAWPRSATTKVASTVKPD